MREFVSENRPTFDSYPRRKKQELTESYLDANAIQASCSIGLGILALGVLPSLFGKRNDKE